MASAGNVKMLLEGSKRTGTTPLASCARPLQAIPQTNGPIQDSMIALTKSLELELNSAESGLLDSDKSIVFDSTPSLMALKTVCALLTLVIDSSRDRAAVLSVPSALTEDVPECRSSSDGDVVNAVALLTR
jgi:hypothetical protein